MVRSYLSGPPHAVPEHADAVGAVVLGRALVKLAKVDGVLERAVLNQVALRDVSVVSRHAHGEAQERLGVGVQLLRA